MANSEPFHATTKVLKNNAIDDSMSVPSVSNLVGHFMIFSHKNCWNILE